MTTTILAIIAGLVASASGYFAYKNSPLKNRREAERDIAAEKAIEKAEKDAIKNAVYGGDPAALNSTLQSLISPVLIVVLCATFIGCKSDTVYLTGDTYVEPCTNSQGVACWAVPNPLMEQILLRLQKLKNLETWERVQIRLK